MRGTDPHCHAGRRSPAQAGKVRLPPPGDGQDSPTPPWRRPESLHLMFNQKTRVKQRLEAAASETAVGSAPAAAAAAGFEGRFSEDKQDFFYIVYLNVAFQCLK